MTEITRKPLCWPDNVARTAPHLRQRARFDAWSVASAIDLLLPEINRLNGCFWGRRDERVIISTNLVLKNNGEPYSTQPEPIDTGVAIYFPLRFTCGGKDFERSIVMTCDKWNRVAWNIYAIARDIEAQRARLRFGCTNIEQSFRGYVAIPERTGGPSWWELLDVPATASAREIKEAYRRKANKEHPDKGGTHERWTRFQEAFEQAMAQFK